jgi:ubiquinone/menaquinone biosynthesis C-methylase UbiE
MGDTAPLPLPLGRDGARDIDGGDRAADWIERLIAAGVEPRAELLLAGTGLGDAALAAARLVGPRGRVVAVAATDGDAADLRRRAAAAGAGQVEVVVGLVEALDRGRPVSLALHLARPGEPAGERAAALARFERTLAPGGRALALDAPG